MGGWENWVRGQGVTPSYRNSDGLWAEQRRRIDHGDGDGWVLSGSSRTLFDIQLPVWERLDGRRPVQLALEGSSPVTVMEQLAGDPDFTGTLLVGVAPGLFFSGYELRRQRDGPLSGRDTDPAVRAEGVDAGRAVSGFLQF